MLLYGRKKIQIYDFIIKKLERESWYYDNNDIIRLQCINRSSKKEGDNRIKIDITITTYFMFLHRIYFSCEYEDKCTRSQTTTIFSKIALAIFKKRRKMSKAERNKQNERLATTIDLLIASEK